MDCYGLSLLMLTILTGVSCQQLTAVEDEVSSLEGTSTTLSYTYSKQAAADDYFFWYRQDPGKPPEFILFISGLNITRSSDSLKSDRRFSTKLREKQHVDLEIRSAAVTDSAVYYCAVTGSGNWKMVFGEGIKLMVESHEEVSPDYYFLKDEDQKTSVCLATGFSRENGAKENFTQEKFNPTKPARNVKDKDSSDFGFYSQVAFMDDRTTCEGSKPTETPACEATLEPDNMVNLASLTIYCLRLIFIKTVIFNVLMTLRLWVSQ